MRLARGQMGGMGKQANWKKHESLDVQCAMGGLTKDLHRLDVCSHVVFDRFLLLLLMLLLPLLLLLL